MPRKIAGSAIRRLEALTSAMTVPSVVLERAIHLYCTCRIWLPLAVREGVRRPE